MKENLRIITTVIIYTVVSLLVAAVVILSLCLMIAMPGILAWLANYIGVTAYVIFFGAVAALISWSANRD